MSPRPSFDRKDDKRISDSAALRPDLVYEVIRREGESELGRGARGLIFSAIAAGLAISFSVVAEAMIAARLPHEPWAELIADMGYTVGFVMVIIGRLQLFTEHTVTAVLPVVYAPTGDNLWRLLRLWLLVLGGNVVGTVIAAWFLILSGALPQAGIDAVIDIGRHMTGDPFWITVAKGVGAGFLIAALVWMLPAAGAGQFAVIFLITWIIALAGFAHIVAGTVEIAALVFAGENTIWEVLVDFWFPALIGNLIGGTALFAMLAYGQVQDEI